MEFREEDLLFHCKIKGKKHSFTKWKIANAITSVPERQTERQMSGEISLNKNMYCLFQFQFSHIYSMTISHCGTFIAFYSRLEFLATQLSSHCHCRRQETAMRLFTIILCDEIGEGTFSCWMRNENAGGCRWFVINIYTWNLPVGNVIREREKMQSSENIFSLQCVVWLHLRSIAWKPKKLCWVVLCSVCQTWDIKSRPRHVSHAFPLTHTRKHSQRINWSTWKTFVSFACVVRFWAGSY